MPSDLRPPTLESAGRLYALLGPLLDGRGVDLGVVRTEALRLAHELGIDREYEMIRAARARVARIYGEEG